MQQTWMAWLLEDPALDVGEERRLVMWKQTSKEAQPGRGQCE